MVEGEKEAKAEHWTRKKTLWLFQCSADRCTTAAAAAAAAAVAQRQQMSASWSGIRR
jgi:hypothetical protein